ncbi:hypothetical protein [Methylomonas sp. MgM2]
MNSNLNHVRRKFVRRQNERRKNNFEFNSPEWIAMMQEHYVLWPKYDRRKHERRSRERRKSERRNTERKSATAKYLRQTKFLSSDDILDDAEKRMILDLFRKE